MTKTSTNFIVFFGPMAGGKTLAAVKYIFELSERNKKVKIISNIHLKNIRYKLFNKRAFLKYKNKIVFLDMIDFYYDYVGRHAHKNIVERLDTFFENDNILIATLQEPRFLYPTVRDKVDNFIYCTTIYPSKIIKLFDTTTKGIGVIRNPEQFYGLYDTTEIPNWNGKKLI